MGSLLAVHGLPVTTPRELNDVRDNLIFQTAKSCLVDASMKIAFATVVFFFIANSASFTGFIAATYVGIALNVVFRSLSAYYTYRKYQQKEGWLERLATPLTEHAQAALFGALYQLTAGVVIHEAGHALAAEALYQDPQPEITLEGIDEGAVTEFDGSPTTAFARQIGVRASSFLIDGAGILTSAVLAPIAFFVTACVLKDSHPRASRTLIWSGIFSLVDHVRYALSSFTAITHGGSGHDFVDLWRLGLHPYDAIFMMVGIPLLALVVGYATKLALSQHNNES
jgi:hypothetical protein